MDISFLRGNLTQWLGEGEEAKPLVAILGLGGSGDDNDDDGDNTTLEGYPLDEQELSLRQHFREALLSLSSSPMTMTTVTTARYQFYSTDEKLPRPLPLENDDEEKPGRFAGKAYQETGSDDHLPNDDHDDGQRNKLPIQGEEAKKIEQTTDVPSSDNVVRKIDHDEERGAMMRIPVTVVSSSSSEILSTQEQEKPPPTEDLPIPPTYYRDYHEGTELVGGGDSSKKSLSTAVDFSTDLPCSYTIMKSDWMWKLQYQQPSIILNVVFIRERSIDHEHAFAVRFIEKKQFWESSGTCRYLLLWIKVIDNPLANLHEEMQDRVTVLRKLTRAIQWNVDVMSLVATSHSDVSDQVQDIAGRVFDQSVILYRSLIDRFKRFLKDLSVPSGKSFPLATRIAARCRQISFGWKMAFFYECCVDPKMALKMYSTTYQDCLALSQWLYDASIMDQSFVAVDRTALTVQVQLVTEVLFRRSVLLALRFPEISSSLIPYNSLPDLCNQYLGTCRDYFNRILLDVHRRSEWLFILHGWLSRQYIWIADLVSSLSRSINRENQDPRVLNATYNSTQHGGHLWLLAVFHTYSRKYAYFEFRNRDSSIRIDEQDNLEEQSLPTYEIHHVGKITPIANSTSGKYTESDLLFRIALHEERQFDHETLILDTLTKAYESFHKGHSSPRMLLYVAYHVGKTYLAMGEWEIAIRFFEKIIRTYRSERWNSLLTEIWLLFRETSRSLPDLRKLSLEARLALSSENTTLDMETKELEFRALFPPARADTRTDQTNHLPPIEIIFVSGYDIIDSHVSFSSETRKNDSSTLAQIGDEASVQFACYSSAPLPFFLQSVCLIFTYMAEMERHSVTFELQHYEGSLHEDETSEISVLKRCSQHASSHVHEACLTLPPKQWHIFKFSLPLEFSGKLLVSCSIIERRSS
jgi:hypothetical protein